MINKIKIINLSLFEKIKQIVDWDVAEETEHHLSFTLKDKIIISVHWLTLSEKSYTISSNLFSRHTAHHIKDEDDVVNIIKNWVYIAQNLIQEIDYSIGVESDGFVDVDFYLLETSDGRKFEWKAKGFFNRKINKTKNWLGIENSVKESDEEYNKRFKALVESSEMYQKCSDWLVNQDNGYFDEMKRDEQISKMNEIETNIKMLKASYKANIKKLNEELTKLKTECQ